MALRPSAHDVLQAAGIALGDGVISADTVDATVGRLQRRIVEVKGQVYETVNKHYGEFVHTYNSTADLKTELNSLSRAVDNIARKVEEPENGFQARVIGGAASYQSLRSQLESTDITISVLTKLCEVHDILRTFDDDLDAKEFTKLAASVHRGASLLGDLAPETENGCEPKIFAAARAEFRRKRAKLKAKLEDIWTKSVVSTATDTPTKNELKVLFAGATDAQSQYVASSAADVVPAMAAMGILDARMASFARTAFKCVLQPILTTTAAWPGKDGQLVVQGVAPVARVTKQSAALSLQESRTQSTAAHTLADELFSRITRALDFMLRHVFGATPEAISADPNGPRAAAARSFGEKLWPELSQAIIGGVLSESIPKTSAELRGYDDIARRTEEFERALAAIGFLKPEMTALTAYTRDINVHFANKKREELLVAARELLSAVDGATTEVGVLTDDSDSYTMAEGGSGLDVSLATKTGGLHSGTFAFPKARVSANTVRLIELCEQALIEAGTATPQCAVQLYTTARDCIDLFRAVVPIVHEKALFSDPQRAALFHCDCHYLAHRLLTLAHLHRRSLPSPLDTTATFVDLVLPLRGLGVTCFSNMLKKQRDVLLNSIKNAKGFHDTFDEDRHAAAEGALSSAASKLEALSASWKSILPRDIYFRSMATLSDCVLERVIAEVMTLDDISEEETHQLHALMRILSDRLPSFFEVTERQPNRKPVVDRVDMSKALLFWDRFVQLSQMLETSLADIVGKWTTSRAAVKFSAAEMRHLVKALFSETPQRQQALQLMK